MANFRLHKAGCLFTDDASWRYIGHIYAGAKAASVLPICPFQFLHWSTPIRVYSFFMTSLNCLFAMLAHEEKKYTRTTYC